MAEQQITLVPRKEAEPAPITLVPRDSNGQRVEGNLPVEDLTLYARNKQAEPRVKLTAKGTPYWGDDAAMTFDAFQEWEASQGPFSFEEFLKSMGQAGLAIGKGFVDAGKMPFQTHGGQRTWHDPLIGLTKMGANATEGILQGGEFVADVAKGLVRQASKIGKSDIEKQKIRYGHYKDMTQRFTRILDHRKSRLGDIVRSAGFLIDNKEAFNEFASHLDDGIDENIANSLGMIVDPTFLVGAGLLKTGARVVSKGAQAGGRAALMSRAGQEVAKTSAGKYLQKQISALNKGTVNKMLATEKVADLATKTEKKISLLEDAAKTHPVEAAVAGGVLGYAASGGDLKAAAGGAIAGPNAGKLLKTLPKTARAVTERAGALKRIEGGEIIQKLARSGRYSKGTSEALLRLANQPKRLALLQGARQMYKESVHGAAMGAAFTLATSESQGETRAQELGAGIGVGVAGATSGRAFYWMANPASGVPLKITRGKNGQRQLKIGPTWEQQLTAENQAKVYLGSLPDEQRAVLAAKYDADQISKMAQAHAVVGPEARVEFVSDAEFKAATGTSGRGTFKPPPSKSDDVGTILINVDRTTDPASTFWHEGMHAMEQSGHAFRDKETGDTVNRMRESYLSMERDLLGAAEPGKLTGPDSFLTEEQATQIERDYLKALWASEFEGKLLDEKVDQEIAEVMAKPDGIQQRRQLILSELLADSTAALAKLGNGDVIQGAGLQSSKIRSAIANLQAGMVSMIGKGLAKVGIELHHGVPADANLTLQKWTESKEIASLLKDYWQQRNKTLDLLTRDADNLVRVVRGRKINAVEAKELGDLGIVRTNEEGQPLRTDGSVFDGSGDPDILSRKERMEAETRRNESVKHAVQRAIDLGESGMTREELADGGFQFKGQLTEADLREIDKIPNTILPQEMKNRLRQLVTELNGGGRGRGAQHIFTYFKALTGGRYTTKASVQNRQVSPFSIYVTDAGNINIQVFDVGVAHKKLGQVFSNNPKWFEPFKAVVRDGETIPDAFMRELRTYLENQHNEIANPESAIKNRIARFVNLAERHRDGSRENRLVWSARLDRLALATPWAGDKMPVHYDKVLSDFQKQNQNQPFQRGLRKNQQAKKVGTLNSFESAEDRINRMVDEGNEPAFREELQRYMPHASPEEIAGIPFAKAFWPKVNGDLVRSRQQHQPLAQEFTSADTSLNQVSGALRHGVKEGLIGENNLEIGIGKFDKGTEFLAENGIRNTGLDPFNRDAAENQATIDRIASGERFDSVVAANVLNTIKEAEVRLNVVRQAARALAPDGTALFSVYRDRSKSEGPTARGYQLHKPASFYLPAIRKAFNDVTVNGDMIIARDPKPVEADFIPAPEAEPVRLQPLADDQNAIPVQGKKKHQYNFIDSPLVRAVTTPKERKLLASVRTKLNTSELDNKKPLTPEEQAVYNKVVEAYAKEAKADYDRYKNDEEVVAAKGWYSSVAKLVKKLFPQFNDRTHFLEFLGGTSPNTSVEQNFLYAVDLFNRWRAGELSPQVELFSQAFDDFAQDPKAWAKSTYAEEVDGKLYLKKEYHKEFRELLIQDIAKGKRSGADYKRAIATVKKRLAGIAPKEVLGFHLLKVDAIPRRKGGGKYGVHTERVFQISRREWQDATDAPKAINFFRNLMGTGRRATIDVWAARWLRRIGYEKHSTKPWRIQPKSEQGVQNYDFFMGQDVFDRVSQLITEDGGEVMHSDDLQAIMWFAEKREWNQRGWADVEDLGDFRDYLHDIEVQEDGTLKLSNGMLRSTSEKFSKTLSLPMENVRMLSLEGQVLSRIQLAKERIAGADPSTKKGQNTIRDWQVKLEKALAMLDNGEYRYSQ